MFRPIASVLVPAAAVAAAAATAACGSTSTSSSTSSGSGAHLSYAQAVQDTVNFAGCIRSHGVPSFPDPSSPREFKDSVSSNEEQSPAFRSAESACRHLLPGGGRPSQNAAPSRAQIAAMLAFARCLRGHGFPSFPDPTSSGELTHEMLAAAGIDPHQPAVLRAADACVSVTHGAITRADVARFAATR